MIILGVSHPISWNNGACLLVDGQLVAMVEEERLSRRKHAPHEPPVLSVQYCLEAAGYTINDVDVIAVGFGRPFETAIGHLQLTDPRWGWPEAFRWFMQLRTHERGIPGRTQKPLMFFNHHLAHAASSYYASGFNESMIVSLDGSGGGESGILAIGRGDQIEVVERISNPGSWGVLYEEVTDLLGFMRHSGEGKTMGLAPYSLHTTDVFPFVEWHRSIPVIDPDAKRTYLAQFKRRRKAEPLTDQHKHLAALVQNTLERASTQMVQELHRRTGIRNLSLAGGCALNCSMNGVLREVDCVDQIYIQPSSHDAGTALGAALLAYQKLTGHRPPFVMKHVYWGPEYNSHAIEQALIRAGLEYQHSSDICADTASALADGKIVGWFQGRVEIGPRALGSRSILANPSDPTMKDRVNKHVKRREAWRPFAPSILEEYGDQYLINAAPSPFMLQAFTTRPERCDDLRSAIHIDDSCRPQTVSKQTNPRYWDMIEAFRQRTGIAAVLNTSFNIDSQPIVCRPAEAIWTFENSGLDVMAIGDFYVAKS